MEYIGICVKGLEKFVSKFVKGKMIDKGRVIFNDLKDIKYFEGIYEYLTDFKFKNFDDLIEKIKDVKFNIKGTFLVRCNREGEHEFRSLEVERTLGEVLFKKGFKVSLKTPETIIFIDIIENKCYCGILKFSDLCKRDYRVKLHNQSINGCIAYTILKIANINLNEILVDPFCKDGTICIEAFLMGCKRVYGLDSNKNSIISSRLNANIANANIEFIEGDVGWLETKFKEKEVRIVSSLPFSRHSKEVLNLYKEFFKEIKGVAKGKIVLISGNDKFYDYCKDFKVIKKKFMIGKMDYYLGILR